MELLKRVHYQQPSEMWLKIETSTLMLSDFPCLQTKSPKNNERDTKIIQWFTLLHKIENGKNAAMILPPLKPCPS